MKEKNENICVGIITYEGEKRLRKEFFDYLAQLTPAGMTFIFATNSGPEDKKDLEEHAARVGINANVFVNSTVVENPIDHLVNNRNLVREKFLKTKKEWLYFLDSDCLGQSDAVEKSLAHEKKLVTGFYLARFQHPETKQWRFLPVAYIHQEGKGHTQLSIVDVLQPRFIKISAAGLGCCLVHRSILEKVSFRRDTGTEDVPFFQDAAELGEELWLDTKIKFQHIKFPPGDERNKFLDPNNYQVSIKKKE